MQCELDAETRNELAAMAYSKWCVAYDQLKYAKVMKWEDHKQTCPKNDWPLHQTMNIEHAQKELDKATRIKDAICKYSPLILGE